MTYSKPVRFYPSQSNTTGIAKNSNYSYPCGNPPGISFLKIQETIYKNAARPYINVTIDNKFELFIN
jgi:hypothetical protein